MRDFETPGATKYGAQMGRGSPEDFNPATLKRVYRVPLDSGGYDKGGAYWGAGTPLYCGEDADGNVKYLRAPTRQAAKEALRTGDKPSTGPALVRTLRLRPYRYGGRLITIEVFDPRETDSRGAPRGLWRLSSTYRGRKRVIFDGLAEPGKWTFTGWFDGLDGDEAAEMALKCASIKPGDTDREYFHGYSAEQINFVTKHGEAIDLEREARFCNDRGDFEPDPKKRRRRPGVS